MAITTYDLGNSDLGTLLQSNGVSGNELSNILNYVFSHDPNHDGLVPVEVVDSGGSPSQPVPDKPFNSAHDHNDQPQVLILQTADNTVNTDDFPKLQFIVQAADADLEVTGDQNVTVVTGDLKSGQGSFSVDLNDYGNDTVVGGDGSDTVQGGGGADSIVLGNGDGDSLAAGWGNHQTLQVGNGSNDTLTGGSGVHDSLAAGNGNDDILSAGSGNYQTIQAGDGSGDLLYGSSGSDDSVAAGIGSGDVLKAGIGGYQTVQAGDGVGDTLYGGGAHDLISGGGDSSALYADDGSLIGVHETLLGGISAEHETLYGGSGSYDVLEAGNGDTSLQAGTGNHQVLVGGSGNDTLQGGSGSSDVLEAGSGASTLLAGTGSNQVLVSGSGNDSLQGGSGSDRFLVGNLGNDTIVGVGNDTLEFTDHASTDVTHTSVSGGVTTLTFSDAQQVSYSGITHIKFDQ
jgi:Ca2+-binding RTX toxin-like protein